MPWIVRFGQEFDQEFRAIEEDTQDALLAAVNVLETYGPELGRPFVDTLKGSKYPNMKELRFAASDGAWRVAFAFDPSRQAILLVAGDKAGVSQSRFYRSLIAKADQRYGAHLKRMRETLINRGR
ncbi:MAG TPA: type II toxin-antitoxin system RelE/ParE family toxin [Acetobacteraceae bacterium]|jgi:hypothetical protein|nr:type II toxin-antitoxin system RelE/ParE family toxin [Acetobacteraceae bacterium]